MIAIVTLLVAFPAGYLIRSHIAAALVYLAAYSWAYSFQGVYLLRNWVGGDFSAFDKEPDSVPISYGLVTLTIMLVGFGLVLAGHKVAVRRGRPPRTVCPECPRPYAGPPPRRNLRRGHARVAVTAAALTSIALVGPTFAAPGTNRVAAATAPSSQCRLDPAYLPRTPDAAEAWFKNCYAHRTSGSHGNH